MGISSTSDNEHFEQIEQSCPFDNASNLKCIFASNKKHPMILLSDRCVSVCNEKKCAWSYNEFNEVINHCHASQIHIINRPLTTDQQDKYRVVMRIDLIYNKEDGTSDNKERKATVRSQARTFFQFVNDDSYEILDKYSYDVDPDLTYHAIHRFCERYQREHPEYKYYTRNCRVFMIELCEFLGVKFPLQYFGEEKFYHLVQECANSSATASVYSEIVSVSVS